jgi:nitrogen fixation NifU-like protein
MYSAAVLDHFKNPRNAGELPNASVTVEVTNPVCGDILQLAARVENGRICEVRFKAKGCVTSVACGSYLTEALVGKSMTGAGAITPEQIAEALGGLPPATIHAAQLAFDAVRELLRNAE